MGKNQSGKTEGPNELKLKNAAVYETQKNFAVVQLLQPDRLPKFCVDWKKDKMVTFKTQTPLLDSSQRFSMGDLI